MTLGVLISDWPVVLRVAAITTPIMTYLLLSWVTRRLGWWLRPQRPKR